MATIPAPTTSPVDQVRQLAYDGFIWTDAAAAVGIGHVMAESFATLWHLKTRLSCEWLAQPVLRPVEELEAQLGQHEQQWFSLNPQATPEQLAHLADLFTAWSQGHAHGEAEMTRKLKTLLDTRPSATLLQLWVRQLRRANQPSFGLYFQALRRKRPQLVATTTPPAQPILTTPSSKISTSKHQLIKNRINAQLKAKTHPGPRATSSTHPVHTTRHGDASQRFQALMGLQA